MEDGKKHTIKIVFNDEKDSTMTLSEAFWNPNMQSWQGKEGNGKTSLVPIFAIAVVRYED